jgi:parallel beta-helix repeat protein
MFILAIPVHASNGVVVVSPSGDMTGVTDADNIEAALLSISPGGTVELSTGHFYVSRSISIDGFAGSIMGAGKEDTIIDAVRQGPMLGFGFQRVAVPFYTVVGWENPVIPVVFVFSFPSSDVQIADITFQVLDPNPVDPWDFDFYGVTTTALFSFVEVIGGSFNAHISNVKMLGSDGDFNGKNLLYGVDIWGGPSYSVVGGSGDHVIEYSHFESMAGGSIGIGYFDESSARIYGNTFHDLQLAIWSKAFQNAWVTENIVTGNSLGGFFVRECEGWTVQENTFRDFLPGARYGIGFVLCSNCRAAENIFKNLDVFWAGILVNAYNENLIIEENTVLDSSTGITLRMYSSNNIIRKNTILNSAVNGIAVYSSSNNLIKGNTVKKSGDYDLFWDEVGTGNIWIENKYKTSQPLDLQS